MGAGGGGGAALINTSMHGGGGGAALINTCMHGGWGRGGPDQYMFLSCICMHAAVIENLEKVHLGS